MKGVLFYDKNPEKLPNSDDFDCSLLTQPKVEPKPSSIPAITYQQSIVVINGVTFSINKTFEEVMPLQMNTISPAFAPNLSSTVFRSS